MSEFSKGDLVEVKGRVGTFRVENVTDEHLGLVRLDPEAPRGGDTGVHFAVKKGEATVVGFRGTGADSSASPASGAEVVDFHQSPL